MSGGPRPPVPGLIPLTALSRRPGRPRRRPESIDAGAGSRCLESRAAAPGRRRHHRRRAAAVGKQSRSSSPALERPPRVNPIFVWVRQEDTRIVDVKCEDYDKRNRILLTKTAHGWRAIPRTEMLAAPRASAEEPHLSPPSAPSHGGHHHRHHHHKRRSRKAKNQQSTSVQFPETDPALEPPWVTTENVNIESLLPSHTIQIKRVPSSEDLTNSVNSSSEQKFARTIPECSTPDKICDVSPLDNLLAVAELELKQHMQSGSWKSQPEEHSKEVSKRDHQNSNEIEEILETNHHEIQTEIVDNERKADECSYNDDEEMSMNDILSRLEQSLQSPHGFGSENAFDEVSGDNSDFNKEFSFAEETTKAVVSESIEHFEAEIKQESITKNDLMEYSDLYVDKNEIAPNLEAAVILTSTNIKENCIPQESVETMETVCGNESHPVECKKETTKSETKIVDEIQNSTEADELEDRQNEASELINDCVNILGQKSKEDKEDICDQARSEIEAQSPFVEEEIRDEKALVGIPEELDKNHVEAESSTINEEQADVTHEEEDAEMDTDICLDLSIKNKLNAFPEESKEPLIKEDDDGPTDLCIRKSECTLLIQPPRPLSENSEAIQSPQPSGIPAVPASPDLVSTSTGASTSKPRSVFLESLLANSTSKTSLCITDISSIKSKEPLDLGQSRKSASPTVTCSEEIVTLSSESEPPQKKLKPDDITLKNLLDKDIAIAESIPKKLSPKDSSILPDTPRLLSLLKASNDTQDPLAEYKQILLEIDIPNPLMVPKDVFPDLLKHPRREILKILSGHSSKNVALDDILVVYKDKLLAAIESNQNHLSQASTGKNYEYASLKAATKQSTNKMVEQNNNINTHIANKRKMSEIIGKISPVSPENKNSLANDIDAANEAAFNPLFWSGCPNPFEALNSYTNHNDFFQALYAASSLPYLPGQLGDLHPGIQMMLGNKVAAPLGIPSVPNLNLNNPFELSMWQEAMMQASILKNKTSYENTLINQQNHRSHLQKKIHMHSNQANKHNTRISNGHVKNASHSQQIQQPSTMHPAFNQTALSNQSNWQNPYLGFSNFPQGTNNNLVLDTSQFNPFSHNNNLSPTNKHNQQLSPPILQKRNKETSIFSQYNEQEKRLHQQVMQEHQKMQQIQQQKQFRHQHQHLLQQQQQQMLRQCNGGKPLPSLSGKRTHLLSGMNFSKEHVHEKFSPEMQKLSGIPVPIDLSGAQNLHSKTKSGNGGSGKSNSMVTSSRSHNNMEDVPEVGSTTGSIEDMQDNHAHLWHPLFGSQSKGYNPWNLPSLAAMGE